MSKDIDEAAYVSYFLERHLSLDRVFEITHFFSKKEGTALLYSGGSFDSSKKSFLCLFPTKKSSVCCSETNSPWKMLEELLDTVDASKQLIPKWIGYLGYEMGCFSDPDVKIPHVASPIPDALFYQPSLVVSIDHVKKRTAIHIKQNVRLLCSEDDFWLKTLSTPEGWDQIPAISPQEFNGAIESMTCSDTEEDYFQKIERIHEAIGRGDVYQINLSQEFLFKTGDLDSFALFKNIINANPAPFTAYINCGEFDIVSSSPERFLCKQGNGLETRPIKGTAPRGKDSEEDRRNQQGLLCSPKERAELLMITDLMRNDLSRISQPGSVETKEIWRCEAYTNVFHLLSVIESAALSGLTEISLLRQAFPGGSISGCPKLKAMELIYELEQRPRGIYTGSIGYFQGNGDFDFNIAIRTAVYYRQQCVIQIQLGGGIVFDSIPQKEYEETLHKGSTFFKALGVLHNPISVPVPVPASYYP